MTLNNPHNRCSIRLKNYDYGQTGMYFITICSYDRMNLFGEIHNGEMKLNEWGEVVKTCWLNIPIHYPCVELDEFVIMPNHLHGIIYIIKSNRYVGAQNLVPLPTQNTILKNSFQHTIPRSIGSIIRGFKIGVKKSLNLNNQNTRIFQRNYYEHIIRTGRSLEKIRNYIYHNPTKWEIDIENQKKFPYIDKIQINDYYKQIY